MRCEDLKPKQYQALHRRIMPFKSYLAKLVRRLNRWNFPNDDKLFRKVLAASAAIYDLKREPTRAWRHARITGVCEIVRRMPRRLKRPLT
jgi:hypothetical protein